MIGCETRGADGAPGFGRAKAVADAVLFEGYVLYPYRANAPKNQIRWSFGVVAPRSWSEANGSDPWWMESRTLFEAKATPRLDGLLRFLRVQARRYEVADRESRTWKPVGRLEIDGQLHLAWDEGLLQEESIAASFDLGGSTDHAFFFDQPARATMEELRDGAGDVRGRLHRHTAPLCYRVRLRVEDAGAPFRRLVIRVENHTPVDPRVSRDEALRSALLSTHLLLGLQAGAFVSLLDPPPEAAAAAAACKGQGSWPVLAGARGERQLVLAAPIILYDHPQIAPESPGDLHDATEIDELLGLRTATLTEEEKRIARATDPRAAAIVDRVERMAPGDWERLHGARRLADEAEMLPLPRVANEVRRPGPGDKVWLRPGKRRTDAQDLLFAGMAATVHRVEVDAEGATWLAVTLDDDPAAELHEWYGRFHYYLPEEVETIAEGT